MEHTFMDKDAANKIVESYQVLQSLETILGQSPFSDWTQLATSPQKLSEGMNQMLRMTTFSSFQHELLQLVGRIERFKLQSEQLQTMFLASEITPIFGELLTHFQFLQSKFIHEQD